MQWKIMAAGLVAAHAAPALAGTEAAEAEIVVFGRGEAKIGVAHAASEGSVAGSDLLVRPLLRVAELLEAVPGMVAAQHSGSGKANQYFLRGFNLDHGSDFTAYIDGVQMNFRSHGHGQGYLDLNGLIPEIIAREDFRKGPYRADGGDFALAGAAYMETIDGFDRPWMSAEGGSYGSRRIAAGGTIKGVGPGELTLVAQAKAYDGPWQEAEHLRHYAGFAKYRAGAVEATLHAYRATWRPTEQIPERIVGSPVCADIFCSPDPSARGQTTRFVGNVAVTQADWRANAYAQYYDWSMHSNPTYADPDGSSAQIRQYDRRWIFGATAAKRWSLGSALDLSIGTEDRYDHIGNVGVSRTADRAFLSSLGRYHVEELSLALYGEATWRPLPGVRLIAGLRGDHYRYAVRARDAAAAALGEGEGSDSLLSPKASLAYRLAPMLELYANWGRGFHSNDVRGAVNVDTPVPLLVRGTGKELGGRVQIGSASLTATYWWLNVGSELRFVGDSNAVEPTGASRRHGYEIVAFWRPLPWLALDGNYTASHSRYDNGDRIPNAFENAASAGAAVVLGRWETSLRLRHLGPYPLIEDNSARDKGSTIVSARGAWKGKRIELYGELLNIFDSRDKDIAYHYESYIPAFDAAGPQEGRLSRVVEPRTIRLGMKIRL
ncbi:TonB-dependent receptor [Sphingobium sp. TA15]|uniref:TonB-dependent receptor-like protein n=1 Tax=Sphingobium indicum (strain DSM 16413 / CCM 7287 / MTCC 6362 / UT26 / NBRC 101211 / UT26S) TaxID=452662 RepID=D4Z7Z9_SPHIU|nr:TonB-dependent receptor [Sphingobium indicum]BAI98618.1 TonB-dependent receptor-like protein [Sphingobium indicum UT26S]BDD68671.1 TonB-dependent receptor [Sphingobium sp. TA15]